ncbi:hypothetical protein SAMN05216475_4131 [Pseudomonas synxantha]|uniref:Uncharacterized protein n=1 Tax=Pseudomonas synxantha TaxID=47883 RepID=A0AAX3IBW5_9PSED|nr:hypothetical protein [Pseudomonas synxantha]KRP57172.1 hypothetical protein TU77_00030 [Pseudomonas synxantha]SDU51920.1 hypothetical protein SAMN05216475_4131 [Pseudomonas synxantha]VTR03941.1 Uncharacterised protein [Pseudomonas synxantha]
MHISLPPTQEPSADEPQADGTPAATAEPVTLPVVPPPSLSTDAQLAHLIRALDTLNTKTQQLLQQQPSVGGVYQQTLAEIFPELHRPIDPNQIFYSRYREGQDGQMQLLSCETLGTLLNRLRAPDAEAYLATQSGAFYREPDTLDADKRLTPTAQTATLPGRLEVAISLSLNTFWRSDQPPQASPQAQLVALRRQVLAHQLALRVLDATLSANAQALAETVLKYPSDAARELALPVGSRPAAFRLALADGGEFAGAFILSLPQGARPTGSVVLYSPGEEYEEFDDLQHLNDTVAARIQDGGPAATLLVASLPTAARNGLGGLPVLASQPMRISADVIADSVHSLRIRQYHAARHAVRSEVLPQAGELDAAADLAPQLDVATAFAARNLRLIDAEPAWLKTASVQDQARYRQLNKALLDSNLVLFPLLEAISNLQAFSEAQTDKVLKRQKPIYADVEIDPYRSLVHLRASAELGSRSAEVRGYRDAASGIVYVSEDPRINIPHSLQGKQVRWGTWRTSTLVDLRTLASYARRNVESFSVASLLTRISASADIVDTAGVHRGKLGDEDLRALAQEADIGQGYATYLRNAFAPDGAGNIFAAAWQAACAAQLNKDALESRLNPDADALFTFQTPGSGRDWIKAVAEHPDSTTRPRISDHEIEVNLLVMGGAQARGQGGQVVNRVLVIHRKGTRPDGVSLLYTPDAPDRMPLRELAKGLAELDTLKVRAEWRAYFRPRMATQDAEEIKRIFNDTRGVHRYALMPIHGNLHAYLYSAQLGFQLAHADFRSRSNAEVSRETAVNAFMLGVEVADTLLGLVPGKATLALLRRGIQRGLGLARQLGRRIPGLAKTIGAGYKTRLTLAAASVRPLEPAWVDVVPYRLPEQIEPFFNVAGFAQANRYTLSRQTGSAPYFFDKHNNQRIAMRDQTGRYHLYQSYVEDGARYVSDPAGTRANFMVVPGDAKGWKPRFERNAQGGGSILGALRPLTPEQQVDADLILAMQVYATEAEMRVFEEVIRQTSAAQKLNFITRARQQLGANVDEAEFRRWLSRPYSLSTANQQKLRTSVLTLRFDLAAFEHIHKSTRSLTPPLSAADKDELFKQVKRLIGKNDNFAKEIRTSISIIDPDTEAQFVGYAITQKHQNAMERFAHKYELYTWQQTAMNEFINEPARRALIIELAANSNIAREQAAHQFLLRPDVNKTLEEFMKDTFKTKLARLQVTSYSEDFKQSGVPYIAMSRGKHDADAGITMVDSRTVTQFERELPKFSTPLEFEVPRVQTHRTQRPKPAQPTVAEAIPVRDPDINIVKLDDLAQTQKKLLPDSAIAKLEQIIQDIQAGRLSRKRINNYTYVDLPQVQPGSGRGLWRVAIEQNGKEGGKDVYIIRGVFDYHGSKHVAWGV